MITASAWADCPLVRVTTVTLLPGQRPVVNAFIEGNLVEMVVDTGAQKTSVTPQTVARLGLLRDPWQRTMVHTVGGKAESANAIVSGLKVSSLDFGSLSSTVVPIPRMANGSVPDGVIGADALSHYDLELDIPHRTLTFYRTAGCTPISPPWQGHYQTVPAQIEDRRFIIPVTLNGQSLPAEFDTGSRGETVSFAAAHRLGITDSELDQDPSNTFMSAGMHRYTVYQHRFQTFGVGQETFHNLPLAVAADFNQPGIDMLIGADYMHARRFFISYASHTLFIQRELGTAQSAMHPLQSVQPAHQCRPSLEIQRMLARGHPTLVSHPPLDLPVKARTHHIAGCASAMFHIAPNGAPVAIRVVKVYPAGYGLRAWVIRQFSQVRFEPPIFGSEWYYEAIRFHAP